MPKELSRICFPAPTKHYSYLPSYKKNSGTSIGESTIRTVNLAAIDTQELAKIRPIYTKLGVIKNSNGSCYYETESARLYCSIIGPAPQRSNVGASQADGVVNFKVFLSPFCYRGNRIDYKTGTLENMISCRLRSSILPSIDLKSF
ncbi:hypothetical protein MXB_396, partial [Myxobolus squamalis]